MERLIGEAFRRYKSKRRVRAAQADIASRPREGVAHGLRAPLVVSLTSYPPRFATLEWTLRSLMLQSVRPDRLILWLDDGDERLLPPGAQLAGVDVRICPNWASYKKIVPTLLAFPDAYIVTADDDLYYPRDWLAGLVRAADDAGVAAHRAHRVRMSGARPAPYADWDRNIASPERGPLVFPTGVGGVIYAPGVFHADVTNAALFTNLAATADDLWLFWMHRLCGSRPAKIGNRFRIVEWPGTQERTLRTGNLEGDGNDRTIAALIARYGWPG